MPLIGIGALVVLFLVIIVGVTSQLNSRQTVESQAAQKTMVRGQSGDLWADIILGKLTFNDVVPNSVAPNKTFYPRSVLVDRPNNKMYVYDGSNSRILGIDLTSCLQHQGDPLNCSADIIIGQPASHPSDNGFGKTAACNGDSGFQNYPVRTNASAQSFCSMPESQLSIGENGTGSNMYTASNGDLYVTDSYNHRVLKYPSPFSQSSTITASDVWGQTDFTGNQCNKGQTAPDASSLCFGWSGNNNMSAGVDIDSSGNLWVADSANNRILRFPAGSHTADLVIGQSDFVSKGSGSLLNQLFAPSAVKMITNGTLAGDLVVTDNSNNRIMLFAAPFTNGMSGTVMGPVGSFVSPAGIELNPDPNSPDTAWISNPGRNTVELWNLATQTKIRTLGQAGNGNIINVPAGSIGVDSSNNVYIGVKGANYGDDVIQYVNPTIDTALPTHQIFGGHNMMNLRDQYGIESATSVVIAGNQLIVADNGGGVLFWNLDPANPPSVLSNGKPADGYIVETAFTSQAARGSLYGMRASSTHLYIARGRSDLGPARIAVYNLPLTIGEPENLAMSFHLPLNVLGGGQINYSTNNDPYWSVLPAADDSYVWITDANNSRVLRVRDPLTNPLVDVILGQDSTTGTLCNRTGNPGIDATPTTLCWPGWVSFDRQNNLYVSDWSPENRGNWRLLEFNNSLFPTNNPNVIYASSVPPSKIFINTAIAEAAFDSQNHMVAGYQRYYNINPAGYEFPGVYLNPLAPAPVPPAQIQPDEHLGEYSSAAFTSAFDNNDNLYVGDWSRSRVEVYLNPLNGVIPTSGVTPTVTVTPTTIPTPTPTSIPSNSPTPVPVTPTPTPTPIDTQPPTVTITSPLNGAVLKRNTNVNFLATAFDNVQVTKVEFYINGTLVFTDTTSPYAYNWKVPGKRNTTYILRAIAYDPSNNTGISTITVSVH